MVGKLNGYILSNTFYNKEIPKVDSNHTCLTLISLDSALKKDENYYPQVWVLLDKIGIRHIIDDLKTSDDSGDSDDFVEE